MEEEWGCWAGAVEQNRGPQLPSLRLIQRSERCICTDSHPAPTAERRRIPLYVVPIPTCADRWNASAVLSVPPLPHRPHFACGPGLKSSAAPSHASYVEPALVSTERPASPRGNLMEEEWGVLGGGGRTKSWAPVAIASAHPAERALYMYRFPPCADRRTPPHSVVRCTDSHPAPTAGTPAQFSPSPASSPSAPACGPGLKSSAARIAPRLCSRLPPSGQPTGKSDGGGVGGAGRGRSNKIVGPSCHRFGSSSGASVVYVPIPTLRRPPNAAAFRCTLYRFPPAPTAGTPAQFSPSPLPHRPHLRVGPGLKSSAAPSHASHVEPALVSTERPASPRHTVKDRDSSPTFCTRHRPATPESLTYIHSLIALNSTFP